MRLHLILATIATTVTQQPGICPHCGSRHIGHWQTVSKPVRDTRLTAVTAERHYCRVCGVTFRVYPTGVTRDQTSQRLQSVAIMLYLLGLSYRAVESAMTAMGHPLSYGSVYAIVQQAADHVPGLRREQVFAGLHTAALGADVTTVKVKGRWLPLGLTVDDVTGQVLTLDQLSDQEAETLVQWLTPIAEQVGAQLLVTDDADGFKAVATRLGLPHQVCKAHVRRNTDALVEQMRALLRETDPSLAAIGLSSEQAIADLQRLQQMAIERRPEQVAELRALHGRYRHAAAPREGEKASVAYRLRLLFLDRWNLWPRLTRYRVWQGANGETIDGTNNGCERGIGWWVKERYRSMRGYKRTRSAVNVSRFLIWCGNHLAIGGADLRLVLR
jgi:transposase-like protein